MRLGQEAASFQVKSLIRQIEFADSECAGVEARLRSLLDEVEPLVLTIPGVSYVTGAQIVSEIGDVSRFRNAPALVSYAGLNSSVSQSCVLSSSRRQNRRYDFDTFGVSRADLFFYSRDLPSISAFSILLLAPPNSTSLPWCMMRSMMAEASLSSPNTTPHLLNSIFVVITRLRFS